jgi:hypothetical protein
MTRIRTLDFLPEIFKTAPNSQFLTATLDQLVSKPALKKIDGYIGQHSLANKSVDNYLRESSKLRNEYQLEPATVFVDDQGKAIDAISYPEIIDALRVQGANVDKHDRLWAEEYYSWDSFIDLDKLINFNQYYWLPYGPDPVDVFTTSVPMSDTFTFTENNNGYITTNQAIVNPVITLARGGSYTFDINTTGSTFWIQSTPAMDGFLEFQNNISSRDVLGVSNNGVSTGVIQFAVPRTDAQNFFLDMPEATPVGYATELAFADIDGVTEASFMSTYGGIDGQTDIVGKTIIFIKAPSHVEQTFTTWQINRDITGPEPVLRLQELTTLPANNKIKILAGRTYGNLTYYRASDRVWTKMPLITAVNDVLYYVNADKPDQFGIIKIVDAVDSATLNIQENILGKQHYTSPNGVSFSNGMKIVFRGDVFPAHYQDENYYVEGVGTAINLVSARLLITPETYTKSNQSPYDITAFDSVPYDTVLNSPTEPDYVGMNRASQDLNAWSRGNRWFHVSTINASAAYNEAVPIIDNVLSSSSEKIYACLTAAP